MIRPRVVILALAVAVVSVFAGTAPAGTAGHRERTVRWLPMIRATWRWR